jgi:N-acetylmuramoyl-L-alanine amidase
VLFRGVGPERSSQIAYQMPSGFVTQDHSSGQYIKFPRDVFRDNSGTQTNGGVSVAEIHIVSQGEYLSGIAVAYGFADWRTIYYHPDNAEFRKRRTNPDVIFPGDKIFIPDIETKSYSRSTDKVHKFKIKRPKILLGLVLKDAAGQPIANEQYLLVVGTDVHEGLTDGNGSLQEEVPANEEKGRIILKRLGLRYELRIGHLDPVHDDDRDKAIVSGVQARLNNLGYPCGEVDGEIGPKTRAALRRFQVALMGKDPDEATGECDRETRDALAKEHGC